MLLATLTRAAATLGVLLAASLPAAAQHPTFPGAASGPLGPVPTNWIYDTGASVTTVPTAVAQAAGLQQVGQVNINGIPARCYPNVQITCIDSAGQVCVGTTTVYAMTGGPIAGASLLGRHIRRTWGGVWRDADETVRWTNPGTPPAGPFFALAPLTDSQTGLLHQVLPGVGLRWGDLQTSTGVTILTGSARSFLPYSVVSALGASVVGSVDLLAEDPESLFSLIVAGQNPTLQTIFVEVEVDAVTIGLGPELGRVRLLVNDDLNSDFGAFGRDLLVSNDSNTFRVHESDQYGTALSYGPHGDTIDG